MFSKKWGQFRKDSLVLLACFVGAFLALMTSAILGNWLAAQFFGLFSGCLALWLVLRVIRVS